MRDFLQLRFGSGLSKLEDQMMMWQEDNFPPITSVSRHSVMTSLAGWSKITRSKINSTPLKLVSSLVGESTWLCLEVLATDSRKKISDLGRIQQFDVSSSHLILLLLNPKVREKQCEFCCVYTLGNIMLNSFQFWNTLPLPYPFTCQFLFCFLDMKAYYFPL